MIMPLESHCLPTKSLMCCLEHFRVFYFFEFPPSSPSPSVWKAELLGCCGLGSFRMQHLNEEVIVGHVPVQVLVVEVFFSLHADGPDFRKSQQELPELLRLLRVVAHGVVQEGSIHLFLNTFYQLEVLKIFDI